MSSTNSWTGATGNNLWDNVGNWSLGFVPTNGSADVAITKLGAYSVLIQASDPTYTVRSLTIGNGNGTVTLTDNSSLTITTSLSMLNNSIFNIGANGTANFDTLNLSSGSVINDFGDMNIDGATTGSGTINASGGELYTNSVSGNTYNLSNGATMTVDTDSTPTGVINFGNGAGDTLNLLVASGDYSGQIAGFGAGDQIDIESLAYNPNYTYTYTGSSLIIKDGNSTSFIISNINNPGAISFKEDSSGGTELVCYLRGTRILTAVGEVQVENIAIGDLVMTRFGAMQPVKWIGRQSYKTSAAAAIRDVAPVHIRPGALGERLPARDLFVSPGHSMLVGGTLLLAKLLINGVTITQETLAENLPAMVQYFQIELETHDCIVAEGTWSESFADGPGLRDQFHNAGEFYAACPDYRPPEEITLCAPRPEQGVKLEAALRPILARATEDVQLGRLVGNVDRVAAPWVVEGWAFDESNPDLPVHVQFLLDGEVIGDVWACAYREDLEVAGYGTGRCAFFWTAPVTLPQDGKARLHVRRVIDGAMLYGSAPLPAPQPELRDAEIPRLRLVA